MKLNSNVTSWRASNMLQANESAFSKATGKLSSGYKINTAGDDPVGMVVSNKMNTVTKSLDKATQNSTSAVSAIQTADGAMTEIKDMIHRLKELSIQSANGTNTNDDRQAMQAEMTQLTEEIEHIVQATEYNGQKLLNGDLGVKGSLYTTGADGSKQLDTGITLSSYNNHAMEGFERSFKVEEDEDGKLKVVDPTNFPENKPENFTFDYLSKTLTYSDINGNELVMDYTESLKKGETINLDIISQGSMIFQVGSSEGQEIEVQIPSLSLNSMGIGKLDVTTDEAAKESMARLDTALSYVSKVNSRLGAYQNRFEATLSNLAVSEENLTNSYSTIRDTDMAAEMVEYTKLQILTQAGVSMLTQSNELPQMAMQLLQ
ncbi:MAG: hypothetical protein IJT16_08605 [Lachnospiraceae bacterium]|nr:hypothetical protein [Lachnospiraceae bacterium]